MNLMTPERFRLIGWLLSGLCLTASAGLILGRNSALAAATREEARAGSDLLKARTDLAAVTRKPKDRRFACAPRSPDEETAFLLDLRRRAHATGVSITRWTSKTADYGKKPGDVSAGDAQAVLDGVTKVSCDLVLKGSYPALRGFLSNLWTNDRLLTIAHVDWNRTDKGSELALSLSRYLAPKPATKP